VTSERGGRTEEGGGGEGTAGAEDEGGAGKAVGVRATFSLEAYAAYSKQCPTRLSRENPKYI